MEAFDDRVRERAKQRIETAEEKSSPEFVFPKLVEHRGSRAAIQGRAAVDLPPLGRRWPPGSRRDSESPWHAIAPRSPIMCACCWTVTASAISR